MNTTIPCWLESFVIEKRSFTFQGEVHTYALVKPSFGEIQGATSIFVIFILGPDVLAISEAYPEEYRELGLIHELIEGKGNPDDHICVHSVEQELRLAEERGINMREYVAFRRNFFRNMVVYYDQKKNGPDDGGLLLRKLWHSYVYLSKLVEEYNQ